jgi:DNA modification methylase
MKNNLKFAKEKNFTGGKKYEQGIVDDFKPEMINTIFSCFDCCKEVFLWGADYFSEHLQNKNDGSWIVWDKRANGNDDLEKDLSSDKMYGSCFELCWSKNKHKREIARVKWAGVFGTEKEFDHKRFHPTQKPQELCKWFLDRYSKENQRVVDLFGGSGSTLIACEQLNRKCFMMELDEHYCDVIIQRWENLTGKTAERIADENN